MEIKEIVDFWHGQLESLNPLIDRILNLCLTSWLHQPPPPTPRKKHKNKNKTKKLKENSEGIVTF